MDWLVPDISTLWQTLVSGLLMFVGVVLIARIIGLRSFAKFTTYDFAITVAVGSILAGTVAGSTSVVTGLLGIFVLLLLGVTVGQIRRWGWVIGDATDNDPMLLMENGKFIQKNLDKTRVKEDEVIAKLRESNVLQMSEVRAVILESTGDMSVLHASDDTELEQILLRDVRR